MTTLGELLVRADIPQERKEYVKNVLHSLGHAADNTVGKACLSTTKQDMMDAGMSSADARAMFAEMEPLQGARPWPFASRAQPLNMHL